MRKKLMKLDRKKLVTLMTLSLMMSAVFVLQLGFPVLAAETDGNAVIKTGFNTIYGLIAAIVSSIGSLYPIQERRKRMRSNPISISLMKMMKRDFF